MGDGSWPEFIILILLLLGGGYFAGTEIALASLNKIKMKNLAESGNPQAKRVMYLLSDFDNALTTILIGNNIMHVACASLSAYLVTKIWGASAVAYSTIIITVIVFFVSEMLPKAIAKSFAEGTAMKFSGLLKFLMKLLWPLVFVFSAVAKLITRLFASKEEPSVTEEELYEIIENITEDGHMESEKSELLQSAMDFADVFVSDVLTARVDMVAIDVESEPEEVLSIIKEEKFSRFPVYDGTEDHIIGILSARQYLRESLQKGRVDDIRPLLGEPMFTHKSAKIDELLRTMSQKKSHMAIVTDDWGGTMGIVTIEDMLEELVGEIWDEDDEVVEEFKPLGGDRYEISGDMSAEDALDRLGIDDYDEEEFAHKTMGAWILEHFEHVPEEGESVEHELLTARIKHIDGQRITSLIIKKKEKPAPDEEVSAE